MKVELEIKNSWKSAYITIENHCRVLKNETRDIFLFVAKIESRAVTKPAAKTAWQKMLSENAADAGRLLFLRERTSRCQANETGAERRGVPKVFITAP